MRRPATSEDGARGPRPQLLIALWGAGLILFNFPMLIVWNADATVLGLPLLPVALFAIWAGLIAALALASERRPLARRRHPSRQEARGGGGGGAGHGPGG